MAAGRYDLQFGATVAAVGVLFAGEDQDPNELIDNPYRPAKTKPKRPTRESQSDAVFGMIESILADGV